MEDVTKPVGLIQVKSGEQLNEVLANAPAGEIAILNFYTGWAEPCKQMNQIFENLASQSTNKTLYISIDAESEACADLSEVYDVQSVPHFIFLSGRNELARVSGADPQVLIEAIEKHAGAKATLPPPQKTTAPEAEGPLEPAEHIDVRLAKLVKAASVMLFMKGTPTTPECGFSRQMVALLRKHEIRYGFFNILADDEVRQGLKTFSQWPTYPQLYCLGILVGGLDIVREEFANDPNFLDTMLRQTADEKTADA